MSGGYEWHVRFGDVDAAGVIYYPRLFDRVVRAVGAVMDDVGYPFAGLVDDGVGFPIVHAEIDLVRPIRLGETVSLGVAPTVGETSVEFDVDCRVDGTLVAEASQTQTLIDLETFEPTAIPTDLRDRLERLVE